jgi:hypothetical protein
LFKDFLKQSDRMVGTSRLMLWAFIMTALLIRVPLMRPLTLHLDEHTLVNVGHDVANGHLPYLNLWDNKPPLLFLLIAPITMVAHHHFWVVRLFAAALDITTALLVKQIADNLFGQRPSHWLSAVWCFAAITMWSAGGALMSETVALPLLLTGAFLLTIERPTRWQAYLGGGALGAAVMVRASPLVPALAVVAVILGEGAMRRDRRLVGVAARAAIGALVPAVAVVLPYAIIGQLDMLVRSAGLAPIAYLEERGHSSLVHVLVDMGHGSRVALWAFIAGSIGLVWCGLVGPRRSSVWRFAAMFAGQLVAATRGPEGSFYLIMLAPFACVFAARVFSTVVATPRPSYLGMAMAFVLILPLPMAARAAIKRGQVNDTMVETLGVLSARLQPDDTLYLNTDYGLYWLLERSPPHPLVTHAGNLFRPHMFSVLPYGISTSADLMRAIVAARPTWIVFDEETASRCAAGTEVGSVMQPVLATQYQLQPAPQGRTIYRLRVAKAP